MIRKKTIDSLRHHVVGGCYRCDSSVSINYLPFHVSSIRDGRLTVCRSHKRMKIHSRIINDISSVIEFAMFRWGWTIIMVNDHLFGHNAHDRKSTKKNFGKKIKAKRANRKTKQMLRFACHSEISIKSPIISAQFGHFHKWKLAVFFALSIKSVNKNARRHAHWMAKWLSCTANTIVIFRNKRNHHVKRGGDNNNSNNKNNKNDEDADDNDGDIAMTKMQRKTTAMIIWRNA